MKFLLHLPRAAADVVVIMLRTRKIRVHKLYSILGEERVILVNISMVIFMKH